MEGRDLDVVVNDIDQHEGQETDEEGDEDGKHHLGEAEVLLPLGRGHAVLLGFCRGTGAVLLYVQPALSDSVEDGRVAQDDSNAGQQKSKDEEKLLGGLSIFPILKVLVNQKQW